MTAQQIRTLFNRGAKRNRIPIPRLPHTRKPQRRSLRDRMLAVLAFKITGRGKKRPKRATLGNMVP